MQNGDFARLIAANVPPKTAYEVVHQAEIAQARAQAAAQQARENMVRTIQAQGARPEEIGSGAGGRQHRPDENTLDTRGGGRDEAPRGTGGTSDPLRKGEQQPC